jgi:2-methylcitrate dehydratase PrpD
VTTAVADPSISEDQVHIEVTLRDGRRLTKFVEQSLGNVHRPLGNDDLSEKFRDQAVLALPKAHVDAVLEQCWRIAELGNVGDLARATMPVRAGASPARFVR